MSDTSSGLAGFVIATLVFLLFAVLFFFIQKMSKKNLEKKQIFIFMLKKEFNFIEQAPKSIFPDLCGELDGIKMSVDVYMQSYLRSQPVPGQRPWMRVRAQLNFQPNIQVLPRGQEYSNTSIDSSKWIQQNTGNISFDQKYTLYLKGGTALKNSLPQALSKSLIEANPPVAVLGKVVSWMKIKTDHHPELIKNAVLSCKSVALAFRTDKNG